MKKVFLIILALTFGVLALALTIFWILNSTRQKPSQKMLNFAQEFIKYPSSSNWAIEEKDSYRIICIDFCGSPQVVIKFESSDDWPPIYTFYVRELPKLGWKGGPPGDYIPTEVVSEAAHLQLKREGCSGYLQNQGLPGTVIRGKYEFRIEC